MKQYRFPDNRISRIGFGVFLFAMLLLARDTLFTHCVLGFYRAQLVMLALIGIVGIAFLAVNRRELKAVLRDERIWAVLLVTVVLLLPMVVRQDWQMMYFSILLCLYFAILLTYFVSYKEVAKYYVVILSALAVYSVLAVYLLRIPVDNGTAAVPMFVNNADVEFYNFGLSYVSVSFVKNRNFGIFREPGVYQFFILLGLYLNNYGVSWKKDWQLWTVNGILAVTMVTTFATGGVVEMGLFAVVLFFDKKLYRSRKICLIAGGMALAAVLVIAVSILQKNALYEELYGMIVYKFFEKGDSMTERVEAVLSDLFIFLRNPVFGENISEVLYSAANNTTSTLILYAVFGIAGGTLNVGAWLALVWEKDRKVWVNLAMAVILFMSFNTQNLVADVFFWLFPVMALVERGLPLLKRKKKV